jgi:hypothetical protein
VIRNQYPMRRRHVIVTAIILALCLGVSSAMAEPKDQPPFIKPPASANVYVPPAELSPQQDLVSPDARDAGAGRLPSELPRPASADDSSPWPAIGLAAGGVVLLCGCGFGIYRTRRPRRRVA